MAERQPAPEQDPQAKAMIACRRTGQLYTPSECSHCPYCFGDEADVVYADPASFCDFHPGVDPVNFGFPGNDVRITRG